MELLVKAPTCDSQNKVPTMFCKHYVSLLSEFICSSFQSQSKGSGFDCPAIYKWWLFSQESQFLNKLLRK